MSHTDTDYHNIILMAEQLQQPVSVINVKTTGGKADAASIIEMAVISVFPDGKTRDYHSLFSDAVHIPVWVSKIHNIYLQDTVNAPSFRNIAEHTLNVFGERLLVGWDIGHTDAPVLRNHVTKYTGKPCPYGEYIDIHVAYKDGDSAKKGKLQDVAKEYGSQVYTSRRAMDDALMIAAVLDGILEQHGIDYVLQHKKPENIAAQRNLGFDFS